VVLAFSTGKVVITGVPSEEDAKLALDELTEDAAELL